MKRTCLLSCFDHAPPQFWPITQQLLVTRCNHAPSLVLINHKITLGNQIFRLASTCEARFVLMLLLVSDCITEAWVCFIDVSTRPRAYVGFCLNEAAKLPRAPSVKRKRPHFAPSRAPLNWSLKVKCSASPALTFSFEVVKHSGNTGRAEGKLGGYNRQKATDQRSHQNPRVFYV